jgi:hypothetical protein
MITSEASAYRLGPWTRRLSMSETISDSDVLRTDIDQLPAAWLGALLAFLSGPDPDQIVEHARGGALDRGPRSEPEQERLAGGRSGDKAAVQEARFTL